MFRTKERLGRECNKCALWRDSLYTGWFSHVRLCLVSAMGLVWSIVEGHPYKFAKAGVAKGVSAQTWSLWFRSIGEVLAEANERSRREQHVSWSVTLGRSGIWFSQVSKGKARPSRWCTVGFYRCACGSRTREVECHFVPNRVADTMALYIIDRLRDVGDPVMHIDCHRAYPNIDGRLHNVTRETVNHPKISKIV